MRKNSFLKAMLLILFITAISTFNSNVYSGTDGLGNSTNKTIVSGGTINKGIPDARLMPAPAPLVLQNIATTVAASSITSTTATLNGTIALDAGYTCTIYFEYGTSNTYGSGQLAATPSSLNSYTAGTATSYALTGLTPNTTYYFRVVGVYSNGPTKQPTGGPTGSAMTFTTTALTPTATTVAATSITSSTATLNGTVNANNASSVVTFEYGTTISYGNSVIAAQSPVTGTSATTVSGALTGLSQNTIYHYRVKGVNIAGITNGSDMTFTTSIACANPTSAGVIAGAQTACASLDPVAMTSTSLPTGNTGTLQYQWQSSTDNINFTDLAVGTYTATTYDPTTITTSTWYRRQAKVTCESIWVSSNAIKMTVDSTSVAGTLSGLTYTCDGKAAPLITLSGQTGSVLKWQKSSYLDGLWTSFTDIVNTNPTYAPGVLSDTMKFRVNVKNGTCAAVYSIAKQINYRQNPTFTTGSITSPTCYNDSITFVANGLRPSINNIIYYTATFDTSTVHATKSVITDVNGDASFKGSGYAPSSYAFIVDSIYVQGCVTPFTGVVGYFTVNPLPVPTISGNTTACINSTGNVYTTETAMTGYTWNLSGGTITAGGTSTDNTVTITWNTIGADSLSVNYTNGNGCTAASATVKNVSVNSLPIPTIIGNTSACINSTGNVYTTESGMTGYSWSIVGGTITSGSTTNAATVRWDTSGVKSISVNYVNGNSCTAASATVYNVTVNPASNGGNVSGGAYVCNGINSNLLTLYGQTGNVVKWQYTADGGYNWYDISNTSTTYTATNLTTTTSYRVVVQSGVCSATPGGYANVTVQSVVTAGTIATAQTICNNTAPVALTSATAGTGSNTITYEWQTNASGSYVNIGSELAATYQPPTLTATTSYQRRTVSTNGSNACYSSYTSPITMTVYSAFAVGSITTTGETICYNTSPSTEIGNSTLASGGDNSISYSWRSSADSYTSAISGATLATYTPAGPLTTTTSYQRYAKDNTCNTTPEVSTGTWTVTVRDNFTSGTIASTGESICYNTNPNTEIGNTTLSSGGDNSITYEWRSSADSYGSAISGATLSTYTPEGPLTATTSYQRYANDNTCNTTPIVSTEIWTVTVNPLPDPTVSGPTGICNNSTGNVYTTESGMASYNWNVTGGTITAGAGTNSITVTWNTAGSESVSVNYANSNGCTAASATVYGVTVKSAPNPVITGSPDNLYNVPKLATYQYSTPLVAGDLYSWSSPKIEGYCSASARNCINVHFLDPCCVYGQWNINVTETNPATGCSTIATKLIYITP